MDNGCRRLRAGSRGHFCRDDKDVVVPQKLQIIWPAHCLSSWYGRILLRSWDKTFDMKLNYCKYNTLEVLFKFKKVNEGLRDTFYVIYDFLVQRTFFFQKKKLQFWQHLWLEGLYWNYIGNKYRVSHSLPNPALKILQRNLNRSTFVVWEMKWNVSVVRLIVATGSSGPPASGKIIKEMPGSVVSGTPYTITPQINETKRRHITILNPRNFNTNTLTN